VNLNISVEFVEGEGLVLLCDLHGMAAASGSSCLSKAVTMSPVLAAIGLDPSLAQASLLLTLGAGTSAMDVDYVVATLPGLVSERLRPLSPRWEDFQRGAIVSQI
jgi:cysteine desulfurase